MKIAKINIFNYRLLKSFSLNLREDITLVIGKNNTGKTSLLSVMNKFLNPGMKSKFSYNDLNTDFKKQIETIVISGEIRKEEWVDQMINMKIYIDYDELDNLDNISELILNLDPLDHTLILSFEYFLDYDRYLLLCADYMAFRGSKPQDKGFDFFINRNISYYFRQRIRVLESGNEQNFIDIEDGIVRRIINLEVISAKRDIDNDGNGAEYSRALSRFSSDYYKVRSATNTIDISNLQQGLWEADSKFTDAYSKIFKPVIDNIKRFCTYGATEPALHVISNLREDKLLADNTSVIYEQDGHTLPEDYNGLGYLNLFAIIYCIHLKLDAFKRQGAKDIKSADINLLFIEEPEAHTHPQMQYSFIRNIKAMLADESKGINLHTIISTHSSHIVSQSDFDDIKYFYRDFKNNNIIAKNLSELHALYVKQDDSEDEKKEHQRHFQFLRQYLTLDRAELFFADKAVFIEGDTERILMSAMMKKVDFINKEDKIFTPLLSQNISVVEVGAYSHIFTPFLNFLNIKTLIITDIDSVNAGNNACCVSDGMKTSNTSLKYFIKEAFEKLKNLPQSDKILKYDNDSGKWIASSDGNLCIAYQINDAGYHPRSFEDAFIATNYQFIKDNKTVFESLKCRELITEVTPDYYKIAQECITRKTVFATDILYFSDKELSNWNVPNYIKEGLEWLAK